MVESLQSPEHHNPKDIESLVQEAEQACLAQNKADADLHWLAVNTGEPRFFIQLVNKIHERVKEGGSYRRVNHLIQTAPQLVPSQVLWDTYKRYQNSDPYKPLATLAKRIHAQAQDEGLTPATLIDHLKASEADENTTSSVTYEILDNSIGRWPNDTLLTILRQEGITSETAAPLLLKMLPHADDSTAFNKILTLIPFNSAYMATALIYGASTDKIDKRTEDKKHIRSINSKHPIEFAEASLSLVNSEVDHPGFKQKISVTAMNKFVENFDRLMRDSNYSNEQVLSMFTKLALNAAKNNVSIDALDGKGIMSILHDFAEHKYGSLRFSVAPVFQAFADCCHTEFGSKFIRKLYRSRLEPGQDQGFKYLFFEAKMALARGDYDELEQYADEFFALEKNLITKDNISDLIQSKIIGHYIKDANATLTVQFLNDCVLSDTIQPFPTDLREITRLVGERVHNGEDLKNAIRFTRSLNSITIGYDDGKKFMNQLIRSVQTKLPYEQAYPVLQSEFGDYPKYQQLGYLIRLMKGPQH